MKTDVITSAAERDEFQEYLEHQFAPLVQSLDYRKLWRIFGLKATSAGFERLFGSMAEANTKSPELQYYLALAKLFREVSSGVLLAFHRRDELLSLLVASCIQAGTLEYGFSRDKVSSVIENFSLSNNSSKLDMVGLWRDCQARSDEELKNYENKQAFSRS